MNSFERTFFTNRRNHRTFLAKVGSQGRKELKTRVAKWIKDCSSPDESLGQIATDELRRWVLERSK